MSNHYTGDQWQQLVVRLLSIRHHENLQKVPDETLGDAGIECFCRSGIAYQCYSPDSIFQGNDLYERQRDKLTEDTKKFIDNKDTLVGIFGNTKIHTWAFAVPYCRDKKLVAHGTRRAQIINEADLPYVNDGGLNINILDMDNFAEEHNRLMRQTFDTIRIDTEDVREEEILRYTELHSEHLDNLRNKLIKLKPDMTDAELDVRISAFIKEFLRGCKVMLFLKNRYNETWESITALKTKYEYNLAIKAITQTGNAPDIFNTEKNEFQRAIEDMSGIITKGDALTIANETIIDWLLRCPLNFP